MKRIMLSILILGISACGSVSGRQMETATELCKDSGGVSTLWVNPSNVVEVYCNDGKLIKVRLE